MTSLLPRPRKSPKKLKIHKSDLYARCVQWLRTSKTGHLKVVRECFPKITLKLVEVFASFKEHLMSLCMN
jgi:hypothetical protein